MNWQVEFYEEFYSEFKLLNTEVQDHILAKAKMLEEFGPFLGRPHVDTLKGSIFSNLKELRIDENKGVWRIAFIFDPARKAILLVAGNKKGKNQHIFYRELIKIANLRYSDHLSNLKKQRQ